MEEKKNKYIWIIVILVIIILGLVGYICYDKFSNEPTQDNDINNNQETDAVDNDTVDVKDEETTKIKEVLYDTSSYGNDSIEKVELTSTGKVLVTITGNTKNTYDRKEVLEDVNKAVLVHSGQSDICEGNAKLMFIMNDNTVSYLDVDALVCGNTIKIVTNFADLHDIVQIIEEEKVLSANEPASYTVYAKDNTGASTDITEYFE